MWVLCAEAGWVCGAARRLRPPSDKAACPVGSRTLAIQHIPISFSEKTTYRELSGSALVLKIQNAALPFQIQNLILAPLHFTTNCHITLY